MKTIKFKGWVSVEDAIKADTLVLPPKPWKTYMWGITTIAAVILVFIVPGNVTMKERLLMAGLVLITPFNLIFMRKRSVLKRKVKYYAQRNLVERKGSIGSKAIDFLTNKTESKFEWSLFIRIIRNGDLTILVINKTDYLAFAPYMFSSASDWLSFNELADEKVVV